MSPVEFSQLKGMIRTSSAEVHLSERVTGLTLLHPMQVYAMHPWNKAVLLFNDYHEGLQVASAEKQGIEYYSPRYNCAYLFSNIAGLVSHAFGHSLVYQNNPEIHTVRESIAKSFSFNPRRPDPLVVAYKCFDEGVASWIEVEALAEQEGIDNYNEKMVKHLTKILTSGNYEIYGGAVTIDINEITKKCVAMARRGEKFQGIQYVLGHSLVFRTLVYLQQTQGDFSVSNALLLMIKNPPTSFEQLEDPIGEYANSLTL